MRHLMTRLLAPMAALGLFAGSANAETIFSHTFNEGTGGLNGTAVDGGTEAPLNWVAADVVTANGAFTTGPGSATLAFTPSNGFEYTLDARITGVTGDGNWVALGFANGQSEVSSTGTRFASGSGAVIGTAWSLFRGDNSANDNAAFLVSTGDGSDWTALNFQDGTTPGSIDMRIVLDTTGGTGNWTATWLAKNTTDASYTTVRGTTAAANEADFNSVGFAFSGSAVDGTLESFSLTAVPEPGSLALMGLGGLLIARRRRNA